MPKDEKKKNIILISIMVLSIIGTLFLVFKKDDNTNVSTSLEDSLVDFQSGPVITSRVESDILSSQEFNELQEYTTLNFQLEPRGKENPFQEFDVLSDK